MSENLPTNGTTMPIPAPSHGAVATNGATSNAGHPPNGSSPSPGYSCGGCDNRWPGVSRCHCASCHRTFSGEVLFDKHRRDIKGVGTCIDPETILSTPRATGIAVRAMYLSNGLWQGVQDPAPRGAHLRSAR